MKKRIWIKTLLILSVLAALSLVLPNQGVDPWNILSPKKIAFMIFALALIQSLGSISIKLLGQRAGAILSGFLGGLISSTATTAALSRRSIKNSRQSCLAESLTLFAATLAMLFEGIFIITFGIQEIHLPLFIIFLGPICVTTFMIILQSEKQKDHHMELGNTELEIIPILKLSIFIIGILILSKILQNIFGQSGLLALTFLVSLFEIHGSVIANVQLHNSGAFSEQFLGALIAISIASSCISKFFLVYTLGSSQLKKQVAKFTGFILISLMVSGVIFLLLPV